MLQRLVRHNELLPLMLRPLVAYVTNARRTGAIFDEKERPSLSDKLFPRVGRL